MDDVGRFLPDSGWISDVSGTVHQFGAGAAGVIFIAIAITFFVVSLSQSGRKLAFSWSASAVCLVIGGSFLAATVYFQNTGHAVDVRFLKVQNIPLSAKVQAISRDAYVKQVHSESPCIQDFELVWIKQPDEQALRFRVVPIRFGPSKKMSACDKYIYTYADTALSYRVKVKMINQRRRNHVLYRHDDKTVLWIGPADEPQIIKPSESIQSVELETDMDDIDVSSRGFSLIDPAGATELRVGKTAAQFQKAMQLFSNEDYGELWNGVALLLENYEAHEPTIYKSLIEGDQTEFQQLGLLLTVRKHFRALLDVDQPIPDYSSQFVDALLRLAASEHEVLSANARILLRTQPTLTVVKRFGSHFAETDSSNKNRLAGTGADLMYNFAIALALAEDSDSPTLAEDEEQVIEGIKALGQGWAYRTWGTPEDKFLFLKILYGRGLIVGLKAAQISDAGDQAMPKEIKTLQSDVEATFTEFIYEVEDIKASYPYPHHIEIAEQCRPSSLPRAEAFKKCIAERQPAS